MEATEAPAQAPSAPDLARMAYEAAQVKEAAAAAKLAEANAAMAKAEALRAKAKASAENPAEWFAEHDIPQEQFLEFFKTGGELTPEQKRLVAAEKTAKEAVAKVEAFEKAQKKAQAEATIATQVAQAAEVLGEFPLASKLDNAARLVRDRALAISKAEGNRHVTFKEAAAALEADTERNLARWLQDEKASAKLKVSSVNQPKDVPAATGPSTLGRQTAPSTPGLKQSGTPMQQRAARKAEWLASLKR